jgi:hypothetical protein
LTADATTLEGWPNRSEILHSSGHDNDDWCITTSDKPSAQRTGEVVARLGRSTHNDQIGVIGIGNSQELPRRFPMSENKSQVDTVMTRVVPDFVTQFLGLLGNRLLHCSVDTCRTDKRSGGRG